MKCPKCNFEIAENEKFCPECKKKIPVVKKTLSKKVKLTIIIGATIAVVVISLILVFGLSKHEHSWTSTKIIEPATCTKSGKAIMPCDGCDEILEYTLTKKDHTYGDWIEIEKYDCLTGSKHERTCSVCNAVEIDTREGFGEHRFTRWFVIEEATCIQEAIQECSCFYCDEKKTETVEGFARHNYNNNTCTVCNKAAERISVSHMNTIIIVPDVPMEVSGTATKVHLDSLTWSVTESQIELTVSGEKTYDWYSSSTPRYIDIFFKIYDDEGVLVTSAKLRVNDLQVGDKFANKTKQISLSELEENKIYTMKIVYGG